MAAPGRCSLSAAFRQHLRHLALQDFPCGLGSWNKSCSPARRHPRSGQPGLGMRVAGQDEALPLGEESPEALVELLRDPHSPWAPPPGCSPQDQHLRETAVLAPELIRGSKVLQILRSLQIVGKGVEEVDEGLLQLQQLEELILSANHISRITSANLPRTLKVLELCCNAVADLQDLCAQPPPELQHLGLGYNRLRGPSPDKYLTATFWPNLVSLDLSFNNFTDLLGLVSQLSSLQKLRILVLQGNPLALIPTYRGFLVDSLPKLSILDDTHVEPEERCRFHGLARQPELIRCEARVVVSVGEIKGVPDPRALQRREVGSEAPLITYSYCVMYEFVEGEELEDGGNTEVTKIHQSPVVATRHVDSSASAWGTGETGRQQEPAATGEPKAHSAKVFATPGKPWADTIDCSYRKEHTAKDLVGLKSYLEAGTTVSVVEEQVLSWPVNADPEGNAVTTKKAGRGLQKNSAKGPSPRDKQKKKKQGKPHELRSDPPIRRTLGTTRVTLEALLATEDLVATVCDFGILTTEQPLQTPGLEEKVRTKKGADKSQKPKAERESQASQKTAASARGKRKTKTAAEPEGNWGLPPVPLTVPFQMQLLRWPLAARLQSPESAAVGNSR
ncbi:leucine-rich repeat-containing protein 43 [Falco cherrug]|uniref:leucine-rich repeat-containing protein 43 n=1 Tax=Falco cherrug TaxID=345164 RepID=UPI00247841AE|nr:leucine-rich repeat-containing protein 43 [Falco cherrug]